MTACFIYIYIYKRFVNFRINLKLIMIPTATGDDAKSLVNIIYNKHNKKLALLIRKLDIESFPMNKAHTISSKVNTPLKVNFGSAGGQH